jgi:hypothetical protein
MKETAEMGLQLVPIEQAAASFIADRVIMKGSPAPAVIQTRCATALKVAAAITDTVAGNAAQAQQDITAIIADPTMDPVLANDLQVVLAAGLQQLSLANQLGNLVPVLGATAQAIAANLAAGITTAANTLAAANPVPAPAVAAATK